MVFKSLAPRANHAYSSCAVVSGGFQKLPLVETNAELRDDGQDDTS